MKRSAIVIGGGVVGVSSAHFLVESGWDVTLVEQGGLASGCSSGNAGLLVPSHAIPLAAPGAWLTGLRYMLDPESPFYIAPRADLGLLRWLFSFSLACTSSRVRRAMPVLRDLSRESARLFSQLAERLHFGFEQKGVLMVFRSEHGLEEARRESRLLEEVRLPTEVLSGEECRSREPMLAPGVVGGVRFPEDGHMNPARYVGALASHAQERGLTVRTGCTVTGFATSRGRINAVETSQGSFEADSVVLAAGSWSVGLGRRLGLRVPLQPAKGYSLTWKTDRRPSLPLMLGEARVVVTPMPPEVRLAGTLELAGHDLSIRERRVAAIRRAASLYLSGFEAPAEVEPWAGLRPCTPDGLPILGHSASWKNLILATGHAMVGLSLGPVTGLVVARLASGETPEFDLSLLSPRRFGL